MKLLMHVVDIYNSIAKIHKQKGQLHSCVFYATEILQNWNSTAYKKGMLEACNTLASIYRLKNEKDSAIKYLELSKIIGKNRPFFGFNRTVANI